MPILLLAVDIAIADSIVQQSIYGNVEVSNDEDIFERGVVFSHPSHRLKTYKRGDRQDAATQVCISNLQPGSSKHLSQSLQQNPTGMKFTNYGTIYI